MKIVRMIGTVSLIGLAALFWKFAIFILLGVLVFTFIFRRFRKNKKPANNKWGYDKKW